MNEEKDTVASQDVIEQVAEKAEAVEAVEGGKPEAEEQQVPLSALQKERKKRQEAEQRAKIYEEMQSKAYAQPSNNADDERRYEPVTVGELEEREKKLAAKAVREAHESLWMRQNPEKVEELNERLPDFLKTRPNLAAAIEASHNRYEEAWELLDKLSPKQKMALKAQAKKEAPMSPSSMPKAGALNQAIDVMSMSDSDFRAWRVAQRKKR